MVPVRKSHKSSNLIEIKKYGEDKKNKERVLWLLYKILTHTRLRTSPSYTDHWIEPPAFNDSHPMTRRNGIFVENVRLTYKFFYSFFCVILNSNR